MEPERPEVYERIPWETLEKKSSDRQWMFYAVAGAIALGALAYSFVRSQPAAVAPVSEPQPEVSTSVAPVVDSSVPEVHSPVLMAEADLYAVDPDRLIDRAMAHAEWFAVEYFSVDGSAESGDVIASLLPEGVPPPEAPEGVQVFVDWARAQSATELGATSFEVEVLVRSLLSRDEGGFTRQTPQLALVPVTIGEDGLPRVTSPPIIRAVPHQIPAPLELTDVPEQIRAQLESTHGQVVGGIQVDEGSWRLVVMTAGVDGVIRPVTMVYP
jgi:hypothetical protein